MTYVQHLFMCLFAISISSLVRCLLRSLVHFSIRLFVFLLLSFKSSYNLIRVLYEMGLLQIFLLSVACLFILLTVFFAKQKILI